MSNNSCQILWEKMEDVSDQANIYKDKHADLCRMNDLKENELFCMIHHLKFQVSKRDDRMKDNKRVQDH